MTDICTIFSDGSSKGNPGPGGWGAIVASADRVIELGGAEAHTTNNRMELAAAIRALASADPHADIVLHTDSAYVVNGITKWARGWQRNGWRTKTKDDVLNRDLWEELLAVSAGKNIVWRRVPGHAGVPGNERCDEIANAFADGRPIELFAGDAKEYPISISAAAGAAPAARTSSRRGAAYSYVSMVNGVVETHPTWAACERRVKGASGAKFKKASSAADEEEIIRSWRGM